MTGKRKRRGRTEHTRRELAAYDVPGGEIVLYQAPEGSVSLDVRLLFHVVEAMSLECVRNLGHMREMVLLIRNIAAQARAPGEVMEWIEIVQDDLDAVFTALAEGRTG